MFDCNCNEKSVKSNSKIVYEHFYLDLINDLQKFSVSECVVDIKKFLKKLNSMYFEFFANKI